MNEPHRVSEDTYILPSHFAIPGVGVLPVNAFLILGEEPVLVDTGLARESEEFLEALRTVIDPRELRWIWLTHDDSDHTGSLQKVLELAPRAKLLTHPFAALRMSGGWAVPLERVHVVAPGDSVNVGDRELAAIKPVLFDNPMSVGIYDASSGALFWVDACGAILPRESKDAAEFSEDELRQGILAWEMGELRFSVGRSRRRGEVRQAAGRSSDTGTGAHPFEPSPSGPRYDRSIVRRARSASHGCALRVAGPGGVRPCGRGTVRLILDPLEVVEGLREEAAMAGEYRKSSLPGG